MPFKRLTVLLNEVFHLSVSQGTVQNILERFEQRTSSAYQTIRQMLSHAPVVGVDETSTNINGKNHWSLSIAKSQSNLYYIGSFAKHKRIYGYYASRDDKHNTRVGLLLWLFQSECGKPSNMYGTSAARYTLFIGTLSDKSMG
jgi:hypothetical protein